MVSKRMNEGITMNVRCSTTPNDKVAKSINDYAKSEGEKLTDKQHKFSWNNINWNMVETHVNRLQVRITKAVIDKKWNLVKRLSYLLTHSHYAKLLAVRKVIQNKGKRTSGIDGELWSTPISKTKAVLKLSDKNYKAKPLKRLFIEKYGSDKKRPLGIPTHWSSVKSIIQSLDMVICN